MNKWIKRWYVLVLALVFAISPIVGSSADQITTTVNSSTMHSTYAITTTNSTTHKHSSPIQTVVHKQGTPSTRCLDGTYYFDAQASLTSPMYSSTFQSHCNTLGLVYTKQMTASGIYCTIPAYEPNGTYKIYVIWSGVRLNQTVKTVYSGGYTINQDRTVSYVPCPTSCVVSAVYGL